MTTKPFNNLRELALSVTRGELRRPWHVQTSNSHRRIGTDRCDGDVLCAVAQPADGHPDLHASPDVLDYIVAAHPFAILRLLEELEAAHHALHHLRRKIAGHDQAFLDAGAMAPQAFLDAGTMAHPPIAGFALAQSSDLSPGDAVACMLGRRNDQHDAPPLDEAKPQDQVDEIAQIKRTIEPSDVEWEMDWNVELFPNKPASDMIFEEQAALALLLLNDVCYLNSFWHEEAWPEDAKKCINVFVGCSDVFAFACADSERLPYDQIEPLYRLWMRDPTWGPVAWAVRRRGELPIAPVERALREAGHDVDAWGLGANVSNAQTQAAFARTRAQANREVDEQMNDE